MRDLKMKRMFQPLIAVALIAWLPAVSAQQTKGPGEIRLPMTLQADQQTSLRARVEGYVDQVRVDIGDEVQQGQVLITLDAPELQAEVHLRKQKVAQAEAQLLVAQGAVTTAQARLRQAQAALQEQAVMKQLRESQRDRYQELVRGGAVQQEKHDEAVFAVLAVEAAVARIDAEVAAARAEVDAAKNAVAFASSGVNVAKAEMAHAETQDQLREITAPFSGLVTHRHVDPGRLVSPGSMMGEPLLVIEKIDVLRGVMTVPAAQASSVGIGDTVTLIGFGGDVAAKSPSGESPQVSRIGQSLNEKTRTMRVEIDVQNPYDKASGRRRFLSGQYGTAVIQLSKQ
jgi:multidrug resistance efflux pump